MTLLVVAAIALAIVAGFWYSYYQSVRKLRAHDQETVRLMEQERMKLQSGGASPDALHAAQQRIDEFRTKHKMR